MKLRLESAITKNFGAYWVLGGWLRACYDVVITYFMFTVLLVMASCLTLVMFVFGWIGPNVQVNCMDRVVTQNGLLQGANIKLADRSK